MCCFRSRLSCAVFLCSQGVIQNLKPYTAATTVEGAKQTIAQGPVASQEAIKELGTNGGGFFNANSAHPFENPTPLTNFARDVPASGYPRGPHLHVRAHGPGYPPGLGAFSALSGHGAGRGVRLLRIRTGRKPHSGQAGDPDRGHSGPGRRQHGGQGSPLSAWPTPRSGRTSPPTPVAAP